MNKKEFLNELENALNGRIPEPDIREIISDYGDIFDNGTANGKSEEDIAGEIGSPARIARTILEDEADAKRKAGYTGGEREYTDFQRNINEKTSRIFDKVTEPDRNVKIETLAPMSRRLGAYIIDCLCMVAAGLILFMVLLVPFPYKVYIDIFPRFANITTILLLLGALNLFTTVLLWATNGYTPGKWLLKMRVIKIDGSRISFLDALLRELIMKGALNSLTSGFLNIGSFIWGCVTDDHKTVHDLAVQTRVVMWDRTVGNSAKASNPFES